MLPTPGSAPTAVPFTVAFSSGNLVGLPLRQRVWQAPRMCETPRSLLCVQCPEQRCLPGASLKQLRLLAASPS